MTRELGTSAFADRVVEVVRDALSAYPAGVEGPRKADGYETIEIRPSRANAAPMKVEVYADLLSLVLRLGNDGLLVEIDGPEDEMFDELRDLAVGVAKHGYEEWIRRRSESGAAGVARLQTASGHMTTISNNVAPWVGWLRPPRDEPQRYAAYSG